MPIYGNIIETHSVEIDTGSDRGNDSNENYWLKVAEADALNLDKASAVIGIDLVGKNGDFRAQAVVYLQHGDTNASRYDIAVDIIESSNTTNPFSSDDFVLTYSLADAKSQLWVRSSQSYMKCYATIIQGSKKPDDDFATGYNLTVGSSWASSVTSLGSTITATHTDRKFNDLTVGGALKLGGDTIQASDGGTAITLDTSSNVTVSAKLRVPQFIEHDGDTDTRINFSTADKMVLEAGGVEMLSLSETTQNAVIVNDGGADVDFRVEGSSDANAFFVRGSDNNVGIGTNTPDSDLEVYNAGTTEVRITGNNTGDTRLRIDNGSSNHYIFDDQSDSNNFKIEAAAGKDLCFNTNGANERMVIESGGNVGIGMNPGQKLDVNGTVRATAFSGPLTGDVTGNASSADTIDTTATSGNADYYLTFVDSSSSTSGETLRVDAGITYNPNHNTLQTSGDIHIHGGNLIINRDDNAGGPDIRLRNYRAGNFADGDNLGVIRFYGSEDNTNWNEGGTIIVEADEAWNQSGSTFSAAGTKMKFSLNPIGSGTLAERMILDASGNLQIDGNLTVSGQNIKGPPDNNLIIQSDTNIYFEIDNDNDGTSKFYYRNGANTIIAELDESGNLQIDGGLTVSGRLISGPTDDYLMLLSDTHMYFDIDNDNDSTTSKFFFRQNNTAVMELDESGNLQIDGDLTISGGNVTNQVTFDADIHVHGSDIFVRGANTTADLYLTKNDTGGDLALGEEVGRIMFRGMESGGTAGVVGAITMRMEENFAQGSNHGCQLKFFTTPNGGNSNQTAMTIDNDKALRAKGRIYAELTDDADVDGLSGAIVVGSSDGSGEHIAIDANEIMAKANTTTLRGAPGLMLQAVTNHSTPAVVTIGSGSTNKGKAFLKIGNVGYVGIDPNRDDHFQISHYDQRGSASANNNYALLQNSGGATYINSASGQDLLFREGNANFMQFDASADHLLVHKVMRVNGGSDVSLTANSGHLIVGSNSGEHIAMDGNEIQAKNTSTTTNTLNMQLEGGKLLVGSASGTSGYAAFHFRGTNSSASHSNALFKIVNHNSTDAHNTVVLELRIGQEDSTTDYDGTEKFIVFTDADGDVLGSINDEVTYSSFTGSHMVRVDENEDTSKILQGMIVCAEGSTNSTDISNTVATVVLSSTEKDKTCYGVVNNKKGPWPGTRQQNVKNVKLDKTYCDINSVGEGRVLVTNIAGEIENGDYICTSNIAGYGQLQDDDIFRSYTVAKCIETVDWSSIEVDPELGYKKYLIACSYHCG